MKNLISVDFDLLERQLNNQGKMGLVSIDTVLKLLKNKRLFVCLKEHNLINKECVCSFFPYDEEVFNELEKIIKRINNDTYEEKYTLFNQFYSEEEVDNVLKNSKHLVAKSNSYLDLGKIKKEGISKIDLFYNGILDFRTKFGPGSIQKNKPQSET